MNENLNEVSMKWSVLDIPGKFSSEEFFNRDEFLPTCHILTTSDIVLVLN